MQFGRGTVIQYLIALSNIFVLLVEYRKIGIMDIFITISPLKL